MTLRTLKSKVNLQWTSLAKEDRRSSKQSFKAAEKVPSKRKGELPLSQSVEKLRKRQQIEKVRRGGRGRDREEEGGHCVQNGSEGEGP